MKVSEYINMIKNNEEFKLYKHQLHIMDEYRETKSLHIVLKEDEVLYCKDKELKKIKDIPHNYLNNYIIYVTMTSN